MTTAAVTPISSAAANPLFGTRTAVPAAKLSAAPGLVGDYKSRVAAAAAACVEAGLDWPATNAPEGEAMWASGHETLRAHRDAIARRPLAAKGLQVVEAALVAQDRQDYAARLPRLRLDGETGRLTSGTGAGAIYTPHAFRQLVGQVPSLKGPNNVAGVLAFLRPGERASILNTRLAELGDAPDADKVAPITLRTRLADDGVTRLVRALLSSRYGDVNDLDIARAIAASEAVGDARLDYKPGDSHSRFELAWASDLPVATTRVGDVHKAVIQITNSETGEGALKVRAGVIRIACYNCTLSEGTGVEVQMNMRHVGDSRVLAGKLKAAIDAAARQVEPLIAAITISARTHLPGDAKPADIFAKLARKFGVTGERAKAWGEVYTARYAAQDEVGGTAWGVSSAITEVAQELPWYAAAQEEEIGSAVVQRLWNVIG